MKARYLSLSEGKTLYEEIMGIPYERGLIAGGEALFEAALNSPRASFQGIQRHPGLAEKAACLLYHILRNHPFHSGNKRIAYMACHVFLDKNGQVSNLSDREWIELTTYAATSHRRKAEEVIAAIARHVQQSLCPKATPDN